MVLITSETIKFHFRYSTIIPYIHEYDFCNDNQGKAIILKLESTTDERSNNGEDLIGALAELNYDVQIYTNLKLEQIKFLLNDDLLYITESRIKIL